MRERRDRRDKEETECRDLLRRPGSAIRPLIFGKVFMQNLTALASKNCPATLFQCPTTKGFLDLPFSNHFLRASDSRRVKRFKMRN